MEGEPITQQHQNLAATLQMFTNEAMLHLVQMLHQLTKAKYLCLAGGVVLNCVSNWFIKENSPFVEIYIPPGSHDAGTAIGAALSVYHNHTSSSGIRQITPYIGAEYGSEECQIMLLL